MQKIVQPILKWIPTSTGLGVTVHFVVNHEWTQALITSFLTACLYLWTRFSKTFMDTLGEAAEESGKSTAQWLLKTINLLFLKIWWELISPFQQQYCQNLIYIYRTLKNEVTCSNPPDLSELITGEVERAESRFRLESPPGWFEGRLQQGKC